MRARIMTTVIAVVAVGIYFLWTKYLRNPDVWVTLDNPGNAPITITLNGKDMGSIAPHTYKRLEGVKPGKYQLVAKNDQGTVVEQADYTVEPTSRGGSDVCYVYNLTGTGKYLLFTVNYSVSGLIPPAEKVVGTEGKFFHINQTKCKLDETIPKEIKLNRRESQRAVPYLCHIIDGSDDIGCPFQK